MAQTIKFVAENGKVRILNTSIDLTKTGIRELQHDYNAKYFVLADGEFAPEKVNKKPFYHNQRAKYQRPSLNSRFV